MSISGLQKKVSQNRHHHRSTIRRTVRRTTRATIRTRWRAPDDFGAALNAFARAICASRRLARLAPEFFDSAVVDRKRRATAARNRWMALWQPALDRVYGTGSTPPDPAADLPALPSKKMQQAVEGELASWNLWMAAGQMALEQHRRRRPHALPSFSRLVRLIKIAVDFGRLAAGLDSARPDQAPVDDDPDFQQALADLKRAYGPLPQSPSSPPAAQTGSDHGAPESPPVPDSTPIQSVDSGAEKKLVPNNLGSSAAEVAVSPAEPSPIGQKRCDAWSRWSRQMRHLKGR